MTSATEAYRKRRGGRGVYGHSSRVSGNSGTKSETVEISRSAARDYLSPDQVSELLRQAPYTTRSSGMFVQLAMLIQWRAGLRISETCALEWRDVDLELGQLTVRLGKGGKSRAVPLQRELADRLAIIQDFMTGPRLVPLSDRRIRQCYAGAVQRSVTAMPEIGLKKISSHTFRRSAAIHWLASGIPINQVQRWLGHSSIKTTEIYVNLIADLPGMMDRVP